MFEVPEELLVLADAVLAGLTARALSVPGSSTSYELAEGDLGLCFALLHAGERIAYGEHAARYLLARAWELGLNAERDGLFDGASGLAMLIGAAPGYATPSMVHWRQQFFDRICAQCGDGNGPTHFDLIEGASGHLVAAINGKASAAHVRKIAERVVAFVSPGSEGPALVTPQAFKQRETRAGPGAVVRNYGTAHGLTGVLAALTASRGLAESPAVDDVIESGTDSLLRLVLTRQDREFPSYCVDGVMSSAPQMAWCYGLLPVVLYLLTVGVRNDVLSRRIDAWSGRDGWRDYVSAQDPWSFCHGRTGTAYFLGAVAQVRAHESLWTVAMKLLGSALEACGQDEASFRGRGLLTGALGPATAAYSLASRKPIGPMHVVGLVPP